MRLSFVTCSMRRTLVVIVFVSVLPALAIILYSAFEDSRHAFQDAELSAERLAMAMAELQERNTGSLRQLLVLLAGTFNLVAKNDGNVSELIRSLEKDAPLLANIFVTDADGRSVAAMRPNPGLVIGDRPYFREAMASGAFTAGTYQIGRTVNAPVFPFALPIRNDHGDVTGMAVAALSLTNYADIFVRASLPRDSVFSVSDRDGVRLCRYPLDEHARAGQPLPEGIWDIMAKATGPGSAIMTGADGVKRIYAFTQLRLSPDEPPYMHILVGIPQAQAMAEANAALRRNILLLGLATIMAVGIAWALWKFVAGRRLDGLVAVTGRLGAGEFEARVNDPSTCGEVGALERSVNAMAQALAESAQNQKLYEHALKKAHDELEQRVEERTRELKDANKRLKSEMFERERAELAMRASESKYRSLYENAAAGILILDEEGRILDANPAALALLEYLPEGLRGRPYREIIHPDNLEIQPLRLSQLAEGKPVRTERLLVSGRGKFVPVDVACSRMSGGMLQVVFTDATQRKQFEQLRDDVDRILRHDLKTPLLGMSQIPSLMLRDDSLTQRHRTYLELMRDSAGKMLNTINMSMVIYKMETGQYTCDLIPFDLLQTLQRTAAEAAILADTKKVRISVTLDEAEALPGEAFPVTGEESLCVTMLENLIKNAIEAAPELSVISLELETSARSLTIRNEGEVPMDIRSRFFEKYATSGKKWGTGLGTYSARLIATAHGWGIRLDASLPGKTSIVITFPPDGEPSVEV